MIGGKRFITEFPLLGPGDLLPPRIKGGLFKTFYGREATLSYFGRGALWAGVNSLKLSAGDNILVPAYHCGVEIEAVTMTGAELRYYDLKKDLSITAADLSPLIDAGTRAVLLIHYFGFPQPVEKIKALCSAKGIILIEDCCHALLSSLGEKPLGTFGDLAIYSQRKSLPLPDGGALLVNNSALSPKLPTEKPEFSVTVKKCLGMLLRAAFNLDPRNELPIPLERLAASFNRSVARKSGARYSTGLEINQERCNLAMSELSRRIMERTLASVVIRVRRENYSTLLKELTETTEVQIIRPRLPQGVCPLFFPLLIEGVSRDALQERLLKSGVGSYVFGADLHPTLPRNRFPNAKTLSRKVLCLPVHQELRAGDMSIIATTLRREVKELLHADAH